jgi:hypothetical protein
MLGLLFSSDGYKLDTETHTKALPPSIIALLVWVSLFYPPTLEAP